jgi:Xaa-Pro dipeptidase
LHRSWRKLIIVKPLLRHHTSFEDATDLVEEARRIKSPAEIRCLELACEIGEKAIQAVIDTAKVGVSDFDIKAKMMDTRFRNGGDFFSMIILSSGKEITHGGQREFQSPARALEHGDLILTEFDGKYCGYWAQFNQPFSVGEPDKEWRKIAKVAIESFNNGFKTLKPGITAGELDEAFQSIIKKAGYISTNPPFHGLGLDLEMPMGTYPMQTLHKPPSTSAIEAGMVLEFEPSVVTMDKKRGLTLGSPVLVTETGCRLLSKSWKPELLIC